MSWMLRSIYRLLSPSGTRAQLSILILHRVLPVPDPLLPWDPDAAHFDAILRFLDQHFTVLSLSDAIERLKVDRLPEAAACITFDDGYADNVAVALPLLQRHGFPATFFIATAFLDGGRMWNDDVIEAVRTAPAGKIDLSELGLGTYDIGDDTSRVQCYSAVLRGLKYFPHARRAEVAREIAHRAGVHDASMLMMAESQVRELHGAGFEVGAHTHTHPILELMSDREAEREMAEGKERLEATIGSRIDLFAYPNGIPGKDYSASHVAMARRVGFSAAVSTAIGTARRGDDVFQLPRFMPWDRAPLKFGLRWAAYLAHS